MGSQAARIVPSSGPHGAHGFYRRDAQPVSAIVEFVRSR
jgi:hypothetical protein